MNKIFGLDEFIKSGSDCIIMFCIHRYCENTYFYGVFDGHNGPRTADFTSQRIPAEILLGQLMGKESDAEVQEILRQAFLAVEKGFFESIDDLLAEKEKLRLQLQVSKMFVTIKYVADLCFNI